MAKKKTHEQFKEDLFNKCNGEYEVLEQYINNNTTLKFKHIICGRIFNAIPRLLLGGSSKCDCLKKNRKTNEQFVEEVEQLVGEEYLFMDEYKNSHTLLKCKHKNCGHTWYIRPNNFFKGHRCPICSAKKNGDNLRRSQESVSTQIKEISNNKYAVVGKYINADIPIDIKHRECGYIFKMRCVDFARGQRCPSCANKKRIEKKVKSHDKFIKEIKDIYNDEYTVLGIYKNAKTKIMVRHNKCNRVWSVQPDSLLSRTGCPSCKESKGEKQITNILNKWNFKYTPQHRIKECKNERPLPFDFGVFSNKKLIALIEYQGRQHYEVVEHWGGQKGLEERKRNDNIKKNYCKANNIPLIEIPYTVEDIEGYLENELTQINNAIQLSIL